MRAKFDMPKMERSLKHFAKDFGETNAQAVVRWSVQVCRELAFETQPWGKKDLRKRHEAAIYKDIRNVVHVPDRIPTSSRNKKLLRTPQEVVEWVNSRRGRIGRRTPRLPIAERKICSEDTLRGAVKIKMAAAGIAKGGWLGAGIKIAAAQTGQDRIQIGKNFMGYAQKFEYFGRVKKPQADFKPVAEVTNLSSHVADEYVLKRSAMEKAMQFGLRKTLSWYRAAMRRLDQKKAA